MSVWISLKTNLDVIQTTLCNIYYTVSVRTKKCGSIKQVKIHKHIFIIINNEKKHIIERQRGNFCSVFFYYFFCLLTHTSAGEFHPRYVM